MCVCARCVCVCVCVLVYMFSFAIYPTSHTHLMFEHPISHSHPVLDSKPRESDTLNLVGGKMSVDPPNLQIRMQLSGVRDGSVTFV